MKRQATALPVFTGPSRPSPLRPLAALLALVAALGLLGAALAGTFSVRQVVVVGANLPRARIVAAAGVLGQNIFTVQSDQVVTRLSRVRQIVVQRVATSFPDRVTIYARRRPAVVAWQPGRTIFLLDAGGQIVDQVRSTRLPVVVGGAHAGNLDPGVVQAVRYAAQVLPPGAVAAFRLGPVRGLMILGRSGWLAVVGRGSRQTLVNRVATLAALLQRQSPSRRLQFVDLRYRVPYARFTAA